MYLQLRENYYRQQPDIFSSPGIEARAYQLLHQYWAGPREVKTSEADVRLFAIDWPQLGGPTILPMLVRDFDTVVFNICAHQEQYLASQGRIEWIDASDPLPHSYRRAKETELQAWRDRVQKDLVQAVEQAHSPRPIDLVFMYASPYEVYPETLNRIRSLGIPIASLWLDDKHGFAPEQGLPPQPYVSGQRLLIGSCDVHLTNTREPLRWYMAHGVAAYYFPQGVDPERYAPRNVPRDISVSFVGANFGKRGEFVRSLLKLGLPIQCYGRGWENGVVEDDIEIYCRSQISLGIGYVSDSTRMTCIKGRDLEIPATGSFYLTMYEAELCRLFDIGREIACYRNEFDCAEQIRYYLERLEEREAIGKAGRERCLHEHTWTHRLTGLLHWMGILSD